MTANRLCLLVAAWLVLTANSSFWRMLFKVQGPGSHTWLFAASVLVALLGLNLLLLRLLTPGRALRPMLTLLLLLGVAAGWFMDTYGVAIDSDMLRNALQTDAAEARDFLGWPLLWRALWQAGIPIALVWTVSLPQVGWLRSLRDYLLGIAAGLVLLFGAALPMYSSYASYFRNQDVARYLITPANVVVGSTTLLRKTLRSKAPFVQVGLDASRSASAGEKPLLILLVVGETARAANFSLGGYARPTNPLLQQRDVFYFSKVRSCGTSTAVSVPCMFSGVPREEFDLSHADRRDTVLDMLQRAGLAVTWVDNQSGCKRVCARVPYEVASNYHPSSCKDGECLDDALLYALDAKLPAVDRDSVLVFHAMGSHGPTYYRRVPPQMAVFQPTCATQRIETCSDAEIVNAYDNSIVYTDYVLAGLIDRLGRNTVVDSVLFYVSDHGESLGENGLYLHGQPYLIAPDVQKQVPMLMWFSAGAMPRLGVDADCLRNKLGASASHDNVAHTLLGLAGVRTTVYRSGLDSLHSCRPMRLPSITAPTKESP